MLPCVSLFPSAVSSLSVGCAVLSVDIMDISGEHQNDVNHDMTKSRLDQTGTMLEAPGKKGTFVLAVR